MDAILLLILLLQSCTPSQRPCKAALLQLYLYGTSREPGMEEVWMLQQ